ncbi:MAG: sugar phosphate isomerase/epimerase family protein [Candidatus Thorarchaeota archaeon]
MLEVNLHYPVYLVKLIRINEISTSMQFPARRAYHTIYDTSLAESIRYAAENDWNGIVPDLSVPIFSPEKITSRERTMLRELSNEFSIEWGFHAPGDDVSLLSTYPSIRSGILSYFKQIINLARELSAGPTNMVIHAGIPPSFRKAGNQPVDGFSQQYQSVYAQVLRENLSDLLTHARPQVKLVIENVNWTPLVREVIEHLIPQGLKLCLDIPKLYGLDLKIREADWSLFQRYKGSIEVVHIHDVIPQIGEHQVVGNGLIDFQETLAFLSKLSAKPQYVFEVRPREEAHRSLANIGQIMKIFNYNL